MFYKSKRKLSVIAYLALFAMLMAIMPLGAWAEEGASTPKLTVEGPEDEITYNAEQFSITFEVYHNKALAYLEIDHNLGKHGELPDGVQTLPEFKLYPNEANPWATEDMEDANERKAEAESWGLEADYVAENGTYTWTVTFGGEALKQIRTLTAQHTGSQFKIYSLVCDVNGVKSGSMYDGSYETTIVTLAEEPEPVASTYKFSYQVPADVVAGRKVVVPVTFATDVEGDCGYEGVRFKFEAQGPGVVTFKAKDSNDVEHTFTNGGYWGPAGGFDLPAQYSATTDWTLVFGEAGEYTITFSLIDAVSENVIAGITDSVTITVKEKKSTSGGGGGGGGGATSSTPSDSPLLGKDSVSSRTTTDDEGRTVQTITVKTDAVKQVEAARKAGEKAVEIKVDKTDADVTVINVPDEILAAAKDMDLVITTPNASLELPKGLVEALAEAGLDLSIQVEQGNAGEVRSAMSGVSGAEGAEVLGTPTQISTDIKGRTSVTIPLTGIRFPADPQEREDFLDSLAVFVIHSDGEKKVIEGEIVFDAKGNPTGIKFEVDRFSTFAVIKTAIAKNVINLTVGEKQIMVNGRVMILDVAPFIVPETGRTLVPVRFVSEALGADVDWQPEAQQVVIRDGDTEIVLTIGSTEVLVDGNSRILDCAPVIANNRTFVPLRFVSETLGADVDYNDATKEITIKR